MNSDRPVLTDLEAMLGSLEPTVREGVVVYATVADELVAGISCNVLAGAHHDHILVPLARTDDALRVLHELDRA
ncbi:hypothetical protein [Frigoribacterium sp. CG_9.8]|uniref:hypothetical protein n=1 Tax=Frigoribacterium sp. CG_9.8 TaxID=2787733 RepID=UPI001A225C9B|nr:hypothetical protein [Frigoribacterium sp. CG_9.8]MBG6106956.1 hypothetical protein [Frigoribacterium sp. CG_9.8]